jgi:hypothetical protein
MYDLPQNHLEWLALIIENNLMYNENGILDNQLNRLWAQYYNELDPELELEADYFKEEYTNEKTNND